MTEPDVAGGKRRAVGPRDLQLDQSGQQEVGDGVGEGPAGDDVDGVPRGAGGAVNGA